MSLALEEGDIEKIYSDENKTKNILGWSAKKTTKVIISAWNWQTSKNNSCPEYF